MSCADSHRRFRSRRTRLWQWPQQASRNNLVKQIFSPNVPSGLRSFLALRNSPLLSVVTTIDCLCDPDGRGGVLILKVGGCAYLVDCSRVAYRHLPRGGYVLRNEHHGKGGWDTSYDHHTHHNQHSQQQQHGPEEEKEEEGTQASVTAVGSGAIAREFKTIYCNS